MRCEIYIYIYIYIYNTYKKESLLTWSANSSQETAPIEAYDVPFDSARRVEQTGGMRFPGFFTILGKTQAKTGSFSSI